MRDASKSCSLSGRPKELQRLGDRRVVAVVGAERARRFALSHRSATPSFPARSSARPCMQSSAGTREAEKNKIRLGLIDAASRAVSDFYSGRG